MSGAIGVRRLFTKRSFCPRRHRLVHLISLLPSFTKSSSPIKMSEKRWADEVEEEPEDSAAKKVKVEDAAVAVAVPTATLKTASEAAVKAQQQVAEALAVARAASAEQEQEVSPPPILCWRMDTPFLT